MLVKLTGHKGLHGALLKSCCSGDLLVESRSPPIMPSSASKLVNTLKMSRYRARVALVWLVLAAINICLMSYSM